MPASPIVLATPLPPADLAFGAMRCSEGLSQLGEIELSLLSARSDVRPADLLGKTVTLTAALRDGGKRHFHGFVTRFGLGARQGRSFGYRATVSPWLWFLTRSADCRIFQDMTVRQMVEKVFADYGFADFEFRLFRSYRTWTHCVQYRESDFNFVARMLEHEGIYWWFEHTETSHKLVLVDSQSAHDPAPGCESLPFVEGGAETAPDTDCVDAWDYAQQVRSGKIALSSYDFERPSTDLLARAEQERDHEQSSLEVFDWQGDYTASADGLQIAEDRRDELQAGWETFRGRSNALGLQAGRALSIANHPRGDLNGEYVVTGVQRQAWGDGAESGAATGGGITCDFTAIRASQQYRPPRRTPKPFVQGPQTAIVVGPAGEEIFTDKHGRVKLHFRWDRESKKDEKSSCWVRVSHPWAGKNFGMVHVPRIGQEVVVDFLEGDPDQPIVTGRVYNAEQMPPWDLPANATQSGILTRSSKGGAYTNANMLRFEDKKGSEELSMHAEKNFSVVAENDASLSAGHDQSTSVGNNQTTTVKKNRKVFVLEEGETHYVKGPRTFYLDGHQTEVIKAGSESFTSGGDRAEYTTGNRQMWTSGEYVFKSTEAYHDGGPLFYAKATDVMLKAGAAMRHQAGGEYSAKAANFVFSATGNFNFTGNKFERFIFEGNDVVLGANTNTYIGVSRDTAMGPATEAYAGMKNSVAAGLAIDGFLGLQMSNFLGLAISNAAALSVQNASVNVGLTGIDLSMSGLSLENNAITLINGGGASTAGGAAAMDGPAGMAAIIAAAVGGGMGLAAGGASSFFGAYQATKDVMALFDDIRVTDAVKARLNRAILTPFTTTAEEYTAGIPEHEIADQTKKVADSTPNATPPRGDPVAALAPPTEPAAPKPPAAR